MTHSVECARRCLCESETSSKRCDVEEAVTSARFIAESSEDPEMVATATRVSIAIMKKIKKWATILRLMDKRPELAIWVSDIHHHGRGTKTLMENALAKPTFGVQIKVLGKIDRTGAFAETPKTVDEAVDRLMKENRFTDVAFESSPLAL